MTFTPFAGRVYFKPLKKKTIIADNDELVEAGEIISFGLTNFNIPVGLEVGDIIYFLGYYAEEAKDAEGASHWTVLWNEKAVMGFSKHV